MQILIPDIGRVQPSGSWETSPIVHGPGVRPYIAMSDHLMLFPNDDMSTVVWDMEKDRRAGVLEGHTSPVFLAAITDCGRWAATYSVKETGTAKVWNMDTMQCKASLTSSRNNSMCCLKDRLLLGSRDGPIDIWDISVSTPVASLDLQGHVGHVWSICASETHNVVLSGSKDKSMRLWDVRTGRCVRTMEGHTRSFSSVSMDSACRTGVSGSSDKTVKTWDLGTGKCIDTFQHDYIVTSVGLHENGSMFFSLDMDRCLRFFTAVDADQRATKTVNLKAVCGVESTPDDASCTFWNMKVAAKRDLSALATSFVIDDSFKTFMW